ncbi:enoyl-CoA hydratase/isomerase family protein [Roseicitreum antarcticum]|uniref:3-hydroxyisobutyryl-CoA hydrolase n=1 Tax=Roseicitreum antarcticum TaxID=564137 RepID=A0A1H2TUS2_9RHOB|nr:enoyl-CoA hydratase/isomerase family protein [Roseicitreum antarcticum]SDW47517.1 Enoyl-CoA hydratase/carnithine racemase [Roseicitreum antarcticum]
MADVDIRVEGHAGRITLNRPQALNALTHDICTQISDALHRWVTDDAVALVILDAVGTRAFCAGGDIAQIHAAGSAGDFDTARAFWRDEYALNLYLSTYPKPIVSMMQGYVMGGGVGLGCHVRHRVVGESTRISMPECAIGLIPDVGGTYLLARAPGQMGLYLGLTGARMGPGDAIWCGFADHFIPEIAWPGVTAALCETGRLDALYARLTVPPHAQLGDIARTVDAAFSAASVTEVMAELDLNAEDWAVTAHKALQHNSPLSTSLTRAMITARPTTLAAALRQEYRATHRLVKEGDLLEGIRAQIIEKDRSPRWRHGAPYNVTEAEVDAVLAPLGPDELVLTV